MSPIDWALLPLKKYADFSGRAPRAEYWWYALLMFLIGMGATVIESSLELTTILGAYALPSLLFSLATFVPTQTVQVRRLHDTGRSGYWALPFAIFQLVIIVAPDFAEPAFDDANPDWTMLSVFLGLCLVAMIFAIFLLVFSVRAGDEGDNHFGPDPYAATEPAIA